MGLEAGSMLERYEIVRLVGRGGMGEVYHAIDTRLRRPVALKVLRADRDQSFETGNAGVARLMREAQAAAAFNHPNSVAIYELGEAAGVHFIAMELITGDSFRRHAQNQAVSIETKLGWLIDAARALHAAHKVGIVHRDIKPANIMVSDEGTVKVLDFGLAKPAEITGTRHPHSFQTKIGQVLGTPRYMAPEQLEGHTPDGRSDQFAFGLTAYELLSGEYAGGPLVIEIMPLDRLTPFIAPGLSKVVMRTLSFDKEGRYATMDDVANALKAVIPEVQAFRGGPIPVDVTEKQIGAPVDPSLMPTRGPDSKPIGTLRIQASSAAPIGFTTPMPMRTGPSSEKSSTIAMSRPITPLPMPSAPMASMPPSHAPNPRSSQPLSRSSSVRSSQSLAGQLPFAPAPSRKSSTQVAWIVAALAVVTMALIGGGLLALFLR